MLAVILVESLEPTVASIGSKSVNDNVAKMAVHGSTTRVFSVAAVVMGLTKLEMAVLLQQQKIVVSECCKYPKPSVCQ